MVQSARSQQIVKGDDVILEHQLMGQIAYDAELGRAPINANTGDVVKFFYQLEDPTVTDLVGFVATPVGSYPTSKFTVAVPGNIVGPPQRGTTTFLSGLGQTV